MKTPNLLIDPGTGFPRWHAASNRLGPKEDFALEAGSRLLDGRLDLDELKDQIIQAGNDELVRRGFAGHLRTLNDVKEHIGKSGKDWFFELQRVCQQESLLQKLVEQQGRGLTALARQAGPVQAQRRKGFASNDAITQIRDLIEVLDKVRSAIRDEQLPSQSVLAMCSDDIVKYRALLR